MAEPVPDAKMVTSDAPSNESHASVSIAADEPVIDLLPATIDAFWAQLLVQAQDTIASHLKNATRIAILGPNALELVFPKSYSFSKNYCERPDTLRKIQALAQELAGRRVEFRLSFDESDVAAETSRVTAPPVRRTLDSVSKDPFVQQVMSIFGGTLVDARFGPAATSGEG
jgi:hypothetical protein